MNTVKGSIAFKLNKVDWFAFSIINDLVYGDALGEIFEKCFKLLIIYPQFFQKFFVFFSRMIPCHASVLIAGVGTPSNVPKMKSKSFCKENLGFSLGRGDGKLSEER